MQELSGLAQQRHSPALRYRVTIALWFHLLHKIRQINIAINHFTLSLNHLNIPKLRVQKMPPDMQRLWRRPMQCRIIYLSGSNSKDLTQATATGIWRAKVSQASTKLLIIVISCKMVHPKTVGLCLPSLILRALCICDRRRATFLRPA